MSFKSFFTNYKTLSTTRECRTWMLKKQTIEEARKIITHWGINKEENNDKYLLAILHIACDFTILNDNRDASLKKSIIEFVQLLEEMYIDETVLDTVSPHFYATRDEFIRWKTLDQKSVIDFLMDQLVLASLQRRKPSPMLIRELQGIGGDEMVKKGQDVYNRPWIVIHNDNQLNEVVANAMHRAYFDVMKLELQEGNFERFFSCLQELQKAVLTFFVHTPRTQAYILDKFDVKWLRQRHNNKCLRPQDVSTLTRFVTGIVARLQAPVDDPATVAWSQHVHDKCDIMDTNSNSKETFDEFMCVFLPRVLKQSFSMLKKTLLRLQIRKDLISKVKN
jgi:hypothetical protein